MRNTARFLLIAGLLLFVAAGVFGQQATIKELSGTVELKKTGSAVWENAVRGQAIEIDSVISTGFKSNALISIGNSTISVRPLTRLSIKELRASQNTETINVGLQAGRVRLDVNPPAGSRVNASVQTPTTTASVRGTIFEVDVFSLWVIEGSVEFKGRSGAQVIVDMGGNSTVDDRTGKAAYTKETPLASLSPAQPMGFDSVNYFTGAATQRRDIEVTGELDFK